MKKGKLENLGISIPNILLPANGIDMEKWSVIACDQYTSQPEYWEEVEKKVGNEPSSLRITLPEIFLEDSNKEKKIQQINNTMKKYLKEGILVPQTPGFIYVNRKTTNAQSRKGLIVCVDLEKYDFNKGSQSLIRATEGTVMDRLPPRVRIRKDAPLELPHILILIDDAEKTVIEPLAENTDKLEKLYDFDLMMDGGHITGYRVSDKTMVSGIASALEELAEPEAFKTKYGVKDDKGVLLFAVGDGNHSLASAKVHWENIKGTLSETEIPEHPARYALVELVNVHDSGVDFEPIHRIVFNINPDALLKNMCGYFGNNSPVETTFFESKETLDHEFSKMTPKENCHYIPFITNGKYGLITVVNPPYTLEVGTLQAFLDSVCESDPSIKIDYIHGAEVVTSIGSQEGNMGFYLPPMNKHDLFRTVILEGSLPRKTFSMGEAEEKRFYLECRKIIGQ